MSVDFEPVTTVYITQIAKAKIERLIAHAPGEVGWYGIVDNYEGNLLIEDILVPYQVGTGAGQEELGGAIHDMLDEAGDDVREKVRCKGHSHPSFSVKPSSIDINAIKGWEALGTDWFLTHIQNKQGDYTMRLDIWHPFRASCECEMVSLTSQRIDAWAKHMVETRVKKIVQSWRPLDHSKKKTSTQTGYPTGVTRREPGKRTEEQVLDLAPIQSSANGFRRGDEVEPVINNHVDEDDIFGGIETEEDLQELMEGNFGIKGGWR